VIFLRVEIDGYALEKGGDWMGIDERW
jgi:hypothetical protein